MGVSEDTVGSQNRGRRVSRRCRAYRQRTKDYILRCVASWQAMFGCRVALPLSWESRSCSDMARLVKSFLSQEVSSDPAAQLGFQSIKKGLPASCSCMEKGMLDKLASVISGPPRALPKNYLSFVKKEVRTLFPKCWDTSYEKFCLTSSPPLSACTEEVRSRGGCLEALVSSSGSCGQAEYLETVLKGHGDLPRVLQGELMVVQSAGKPRPLSKFSAASFHLQPLHKTIFGRLKRYPWLLVGPPTSSRLQRAGFREGGGELVSGDYASATDGLSVEVAETILETILSTAGVVPDNVKRFARAALRPSLSTPDGKVVDVSVGQMMGSFLSFPLLCLQNYLAFRWASRHIKEKIPLLINGDDILFQRTGLFNKWSSVLSEVGLTVETTKTSVEESWGTINSTLLRWSQGLLTPSWSPRFGMFRPAEHPSSLGRSFLDFLCGCDDPSLRYRSGREWFKWHLVELRSAFCSLPSLGFRGLLAKRLSKVFDLEFAPQRELPRPFKRHQVGFSEDFVSRLDLCALSEEELFQSSCEVAARKWNEGYSSVDETAEAIRYCLARSCPRPYDYSFHPFFFAANDVEFSFGLRNRLKRLIHRGPTSKAYLAPFPPREDVLFVTSVMESLAPSQGEFEVLPPYSEFADVVVGGGAPWW
uniref:RNA-dependent RNA polymerase n=1 Tax=Diaporthe gulyae scleroulivirus 1 TaxID=3077432 RepID=A0AA96KG10_9VIRU|nr:MAG: RNA-dependent RNA polymerase [Diaporthe gulyae scleroulivirus 1]